MRKLQDAFEGAGLRSEGDANEMVCVEEYVPSRKQQRISFLPNRTMMAFGALPKPLIIRKGSDAMISDPFDSLDRGTSGC